MNNLALPLRIDRSGRFARVGRADAVMSLLGVMLGTPASAWPHAPWFGLLEMSTQINRGLTEQAGLRDAFNQALTELGIAGARVDQVSLGAEPGTKGEVRLRLRLVLDGDDVFRELPI